MSDAVCFSTRAAAARLAVVNDFGDGWMTKGARDMVRIAAFAGFDVDDLKRRVALSSNPDRLANAATVERVMGEMFGEFPDPDLPEQRKAPVSVARGRMGS